MQNHDTRHGQYKLRISSALWLIFPLAAALTVIGAKIWMVARYAGPTPFWDQWDVEGAFLYPRYLDGTLSFSDLVGLHNEHRILFTRLWSLLLLDLEGYWDPILQMLANTLLLGGFVALLVAAFRPILNRAAWMAFTLFAAILYALPMDWESILAGFQSQSYFVLLFSAAGLPAIVGAAAFTPRWWLALVFVIASFFSMASGAIAAATALALCLIQLAIGRRAGRNEWLALAIFAAVTAAMVLNIPVLAHHEPLRAHSVGQFLEGLLKIMSWPASTGIAFIGTVLVLAIVIQAPAWLTSILVIWQRPPLTDRRWLLVAFTGWLILQAAAMAYGRAVGVTTSRYLDTFMVGLLLNAACLLHLYNAYPDLRLRRRLAYGIVTAWLIAVVAGTVVNVFKHSLRDMAERRAEAQAETVNLRAYLDSNDIRTLQNKSRLDIPYPDANRLALVASQPVIRAILPPALVGGTSARRAQQRGLARFTGRPVEALKKFALRWGVLLIPAGLALFLCGLMTQAWRRPEIVPPRQ